jgi:hypothetical protein
MAHPERRRNVLASLEVHHADADTGALPLNRASRDPRPFGSETKSAADDLWSPPARAAAPCKINSTTDHP